MTDMWTPPPPAQPVAENPRRHRGALVGTALVGAGVVAGAVIGATSLSSAATTSPASPATASSSSTSGSSGSSTGSSASEATEPHGDGLDLSGTVTAVGTSSVTIKTGSGTAAYTVDANSDIDKSGDSSLSKLAVGDAVTFSVDGTSSTTIDKLHTGTESLNTPKDPPGGPTGGPTGG